MLSLSPSMQEHTNTRSVDHFYIAPPLPSVSVCMFRCWQWVVILQTSMSSQTLATRPSPSQSLSRHSSHSTGQWLTHLMPFWKENCSLRHKDKFLNPSYMIQFIHVYLCDVYYNYVQYEISICWAVWLWAQSWVYLSFFQWSSCAQGTCPVHSGEVVWYSCSSQAPQCEVVPALWLKWTSEGKKGTNTIDTCILCIPWVLYYHCSQLFEHSNTLRSKRKTISTWICFQSVIPMEGRVEAFTHISLRPHTRLERKQSCMRRWQIIARTVRIRAC